MGCETCHSDIRHDAPVQCDVDNSASVERGSRFHGTIHVHAPTPDFEYTRFHSQCRDWQESVTLAEPMYRSCTTGHFTSYSAGLGPQPAPAAAPYHTWKMTTEDGKQRDEGTGSCKPEAGIRPYVEIVANDGSAASYTHPCKTHACVCRHA